MFNFYGFNGMSAIREGIQLTVRMNFEAGRFVIISTIRIVVTICGDEIINNQF
jgi:hypothetical protein